MPHAREYRNRSLRRRYSRPLRGQPRSALGWPRLCLPGSQPMAPGAAIGRQPDVRSAAGARWLPNPSSLGGLSKGLEVGHMSGHRSGASQICILMGLLANSTSLAPWIFLLLARVHRPVRRRFIFFLWASDRHLDLGAFGRLFRHAVEVGGYMGSSSYSFRCPHELRHGVVRLRATFVACDMGAFSS